MPNSFATESALEDPSLAPAGPLAGLPWQERRDWFRARLRQHPPAHLSADEVDSHFIAMPAHYWERVTETDLIWSLETIHGFFKLVALAKVPATAPFVGWRQLPKSGSGCTQIMLCTWDRHGLLAKAAAAFSAVKLNILQADVFTRADNVALDQFVVTDADAGGAVNETRLREMTFLLEGALSEPPRFASVWACSRHKFLAPPARFAPRIAFDNTVSPAATLVRVEAVDRIGLLYDILQAIADAGLNITQARIETDHELAHDTVHVTDDRGGKVLDPQRLETLRTTLETALTLTH